MISAWVIFIAPSSKKVLLLKRSNQVRNPGQWCFAGGSSKKDKARKLAIKEAKEEIGIDVKKDILFILKIPTRRKHYYFYYYFIKPRKARILLNYESEKFKWVKLSKLKDQKNLHKSVKVFLKNYEQET